MNYVYIKFLSQAIFVFAQSENDFKLLKFASRKVKIVNKNVYFSIHHNV
jgi:hypothetical protein